jgi:hypothetical protein
MMMTKQITTNLNATARNAINAKLTNWATPVKAAPWGCERGDDGWMHYQVLVNRPGKGDHGCCVAYARYEIATGRVIIAEKN